MVGSKHVFWQALVFAIVVFGIGLLIGFFLEDSRADKIERVLLESEINLLDEQIRNRGIAQFDVSCGVAIESAFSFADKIYEEALQLDDYEATSKFGNIFRTLHKRYDLMRMLLWTEGIEFKKQCPKELHTVVYVFDYGTEDIGIKARQAAMSRMLIDFKRKYGEEILLIPIAGNLELESVDLVLKKYKIIELPVVIVDEEKLVGETVTSGELERIVFEQEGFDKLEGIVFERVSLDGADDVIFLN